MKKYRLFLFLLFPFFATAQTNYQKGFYISLKGDSIHGFIDYKAWPHNPTIINFKSDLNANSQQLDSNAMSGFGVDGFEYYKRYTVRISTDATDFNNAPSRIDTSTVTRTVFLKILSLGRHAELYKYSDALKIRFYVKYNSLDVPAELSYKIYLSQDESSSLVTQKLYINQLITLLQQENINSAELNKKVLSTGYDESSLIKTVSAINGESKGLTDGRLQQEVNNSVKRHKIRFFAGAALDISSLKYKGSSPFPHSSPSTSTTPRLSTGFDILLNPNANGLLIRMELAFSGGGYSFYSNNHNDVRHDTSSQKIKQFTASVTPQLIYNFYSTNALNIFIGAGFSMNLSSYPTNTFGSSPVDHDYPSQNFPEMRTFWVSIPLKAGIVLKKKLEVYGTFILPGRLDDDYLGFSAYKTTFLLGVNFLFGK